MNISYLNHKFGCHVTKFWAPVMRVLRLGTRQEWATSWRLPSNHDLELSRPEEKAPRHNLIANDVLQEPDSSKLALTSLRRVCHHISNARMAR